MDATHNNFGLRLKQLLEERGFSADGFAQRIGVAKQSVYNWQGRVTPPPMSRLRLIAKGFDLSVEELLHSPKNIGHVQESGDRSWTVRSEDRSVYGQNAATRATVERYFQQRCDEAEATNNANAFPWMLGELMEHFPPGFVRHMETPPVAKEQTDED